MTVAGEGLSHKECYEADALMRHTFKGMDLSALNAADLVELSELVQMEQRSRLRDDRGGVNEEEIELF